MFVGHMAYIERPLWHLDAPCVDSIDLFYPDRHGPDIYTLAAAICAGCRHLDACQAEGDVLEGDDGDGVLNVAVGFRAGESPRSRRARRAGVRPADAVPVAALTL